MAKRSFKLYVEQEFGKFPQFLIFAILEWIVIIILFVDGILAFLSNVFAKFFELRIPCLLCTRLDHILVRRNPDFYYNESICETHKKDISSLAYCHIHKRISDIRQMCEGCLLSFATQKESDCDTYKSLIGILHKDLELLVDDDHEFHLSVPSGKKDEIMQSEKVTSHNCSCCGHALKGKTAYATTKSSGLTYGPTPSPRAPARHDDHKNLDLPHIRYTKLKLVPDNQSEINPEDEDASQSVFKHFGDDVKGTTVPLLTDADDEDKTPNFVKGNKFFGIPLTDSAANSPRWTIRQRKSPLEKTEFANESAAEGQGPNEVDGDAILCHLKRQVRLDRKSLMALYMELDEERSASAVAANNAMAMITRLQAEKAAVQMEALQYQRMMEEQAEYDQEALQLSREEIRDLEMEIEAYRLKHGCLREEDYVNVRPPGDGNYQRQQSGYYNEKSDCSGPPSETNESNNEANPKPNENVPTNNNQKEENTGETREKVEVSVRKERVRGSLGRLRNLDKKLQLGGDDRNQSSKSICDNSYSTDEGKGSKGSLIRELTHLHERVKVLEADGMKHTGGNTSEEGAKILNEIYNNLQKLHHHYANMDDIYA